MMRETSEIGRVPAEPVGGYCVLECEEAFGTDSSVLAEVIGERKSLFVTSPTVDRLYGSKIDHYRSTLTEGSARITIAGGESAKSVENALSVCAAAIEHNIGRQELVVAVGGGTVLDVAAFGSSLFRRGVPHIRIGTTLLSQVDASVGVKCGVNFASRKNIVGAFYAPELVILDTTFLASLPVRQIAAGMAEILKLGVVFDAVLISDVERWHRETRASEKASLLRSVSVAAAGRMVEVLRGNVLERDLRRVADFGHTVSPILEVESNFELNHGEAVAIDIATCVMLAANLGILSGSDADRVVELMREIGLPTWHPRLTVALFEEALAMASKQRNGINMPMPSRLGSACFIVERSDISRAAIKAAIAGLASRCNVHGC